MDSRFNVNFSSSCYNYIYQIVYLSYQKIQDENSHIFVFYSKPAIFIRIKLQQKNQKKKKQK